jgi:two-component system nitrate/nitrite response regulator NarL
MPKHILITDDSALVLSSLTRLLQQVPGWVVSEASNGREAIGQAALLKSDLVILDLSMPLMNGLEAARELSRIKPDLPVVMFTNNPAIAAEALQCGCRAVVSKAEVSSLISVIHDIFSGTASRDPAA